MYAILLQINSFCSKETFKYLVESAKLIEAKSALQTSLMFKSIAFV